MRYPQGLRDFFVHFPPLRAGLHVLDAGCGDGTVLLALREALVRRGLEPGRLEAFDLTPAMLDRFHRAMRRRGIDGIATAQANVLELDTLPREWTGYDLIVSASMLEYVPRDRLAEALDALRRRLHADGRLVLFITRRNWLTRPLVGMWWRSNLYRANELREAFRRAGFASCVFRSFPLAASHLAVWGYAIEARP